MILENGPTKYFHIYLWDCGQHKSISILWSPFFPIEDSYAYFLIVCKVYTGVLDRGRNEKNEKTSQIILAYGDRRHFELRL